MHSLNSKTRWMFSIRKFMNNKSKWLRFHIQSEVVYSHLEYRISGISTVRIWIYGLWKCSNSHLSPNLLFYIIPFWYCVYRKWCSFNGTIAIATSPYIYRFTFYHCKSVGMWMNRMFMLTFIRHNLFSLQWVHLIQTFTIYTNIEREREREWEIDMNWPVRVYLKLASL